MSETSRFTRARLVTLEKILSTSTAFQGPVRGNRTSFSSLNWIHHGHRLTSNQLLGFNLLNPKSNFWSNIVHASGSKTTTYVDQLLDSQYGVDGYFTGILDLLQVILDNDGSRCPLAPTGGKVDLCWHGGWHDDDRNCERSHKKYEWSGHLQLQQILCMFMSHSH